MTAGVVLQTALTVAVTVTTTANLALMAFRPSWYHQGPKVVRVIGILTVVWVTFLPLGGGVSLGLGADDLASGHHVGMARNRGWCHCPGLLAGGHRGAAKTPRTACNAQPKLVGVLAPTRTLECRAEPDNNNNSDPSASFTGGAKRSGVRLAANGLPLLVCRLNPRPARSSR